MSSSPICTTVLGSHFCFLILTLGLIPATPVIAQIPDEFTNLKVLHQDISKVELTGMMKSFTMALGVRCEHCHVGEPDQPLSAFDFAADTKDTKRAARVMLQMVDAINGQHLPRLDSAGGHSHTVRCATCHRGHEEPETIEEALNEAYANGGAEAVVTRYRQLREKFYGGAGYDFREDVLSFHASQLVQNEDVEGALQLLTLNEEFYPQSADIHLMRGFIYLQNGDQESAVASLTRALEIDPENERARQQLERLKQN